MSRAPNAIDFWRGFALITIFINHIPGNFFGNFTHRSVSFSDSAELFVFLAGWSLRHIIGRPEDPRSTPEVLFRVTGRALTLYAAQMTITMLAIAMLATSARVLDNPLLLDWHNAAAVFLDPVDAHIGLVLLSHQLGYFDILPLYVVLLAIVAPIIAIIHRNAPNWLLPISLTIYLSALVFRLTVPTWPTPGQWFFNPLCWQLVFVLGFTMSRERGVGGWVKANMGPIRWVCLPVVVVCAILVPWGWWPDPTWVPEPKLLFIAGKTFVTPLRLLQFLALVAVFSVVYPYLAAWSPWLAKELSFIGRNSLPVFCIGSLLSLAGQIVRYVSNGSLLVDALSVIIGIAALWGVAWLAEWRDRMASGTKREKA